MKMRCVCKREEIRERWVIPCVTVKAGAATVRESRKVLISFFKKGDGRKMRFIMRNSRRYQPKISAMGVCNISYSTLFAYTTFTMYLIIVIPCVTAKTGQATVKEGRKILILLFKKGEGIKIRTMIRNTRRYQPKIAAKGVLNISYSTLFTYTTFTMYLIIAYAEYMYPLLNNTTKQ
nr:uncharacterized protein LOC111414020 isoform X1 [Onthophagus taurus]